MHNPKQEKMVKVSEDPLNVAVDVPSSDVDLDVDRAAAPQGYAAHAFSGDDAPR